MLELIACLVVHRNPMRDSGADLDSPRSPGGGGLGEGLLGGIAEGVKGGMGAAMEQLHEQGHKAIDAAAESVEGSDSAVGKLAKGAAHKALDDKAGEGIDAPAGKKKGRK